jgi:uracil-DNA glycosylase
MPRVESSIALDDREELRQLAAGLRRHLETKARAGISAIVKTPAAKTDRPPTTLSKPMAAAEDNLCITAEPAVEQSESLEALRAAIGDCRRCKLASGRTNLVFGVGNPRANVMFVGEGPGRDEDLRGEPFVGRAGQLLTDIITKGMKLRREDVYIANVVKCRPPNNRDPEPDEVEACEPFLKKQVALVHPKVIVALGKFAVQCLLRSKQPITRLRGQWHEYEGIRLMPTFHPAYLLRNPGDKKLVWEDIQKVIEALKSA